jgi:hypothetical protein
MRLHTFLLFSDERPCFIKFQAGRADTDHHAVVQLGGASASDAQREAADCAAIRTCQ